MTSLSSAAGRLFLQKLPPARRIRSIRFRRTIPGKGSRLIAPFTATKWDQILDPTHPAAQLKLHQFVYKQAPQYADNSTLISARAFPKALLQKHEHSWLQEDWPFKARTKSKYVYFNEEGKDVNFRNGGGESGLTRVRVEGGAKRLNMSVLFVISKKLVHKDACVRTRIKNRIKSALSLLVTRDAEVIPVSSDSREESEVGLGKENYMIVSSGKDDGEKWIMQDWIYVFSPKLELYRAPFTEILSSLRTCLEQVNKRCRTLEFEWASKKATNGHHSSKRIHKNTSRGSDFQSAGDILENVRRRKRIEWSNKGDGAQVPHNVSRT